MNKDAIVLKMQILWFLTKKIKIRHKKKYFTSRVIKHWGNLLKEAVQSAHYSFFTASSPEQPLKSVLLGRSLDWMTLRVLHQPKLLYESCTNIQGP